MFFYPSDQEGLAWLEASDASWAARAEGAYKAAAERAPDEAPPDDGAS